ncbi:MAG TPA: GNAT family N-acetyltransferase [Gaiellaceae bacterium]|jgi:GNAT superfamily N-acetyltransferase|nr:GNAT family N-acetyltransferase [Gaiellaceae bacterium]
MIGRDAPTLAELAEDTAVFLLPRPTFETVERNGFVFVAGTFNGWVHRVRLGDVEAAVTWARAEGRARGLREIEWWLGWSTTPADAGERLLAAGLVPDADAPVLSGMTCRVAPPDVPAIEVRRVTTLAEYQAALDVDWRVWQIDEEEQDRRRASEIARWEPMRDSGVVHHFSAFLEGERVGFGRAIDLAGGVALMGGAVLPEARGHGVYRALVHARWQHAAGRGTPLLVVQAGHMSRPVLERLGFECHGELHLYSDRL